MCFLCDNFAWEPRFKLEPTKPSEIGRLILLGMENFACEVCWFQNSAVVYWKQKVPKEYALNMVFSRLNQILLYTKQNTDRILKFDWLRAGPYACVRTGVWTGWTSVHNNKGKQWLFVVLLVWVYNKALINLEFGPYGKNLLWRHAARTSLRSVRTAWRHNKYFRVWTALSVNKSIICA